MTDTPRRPPVAWPRIAAEGLVIVLSILLALAADAWWDERGRRAEETQLLSDLRVELGESVEEMRRVVGVHEEARVAITELIAMRESEVRALPRSDVDRYAGALWNFTTFDDRIGTLEGMIGSGRLALLDDAGLRSLLARWRGTLDDLGEEAELMVRAAEALLQRWAEVAVEIDEPYEPYGPTSGDMLTALVDDPEFVARVRAKSSFAIIYGVDLAALADFTDEVIAALYASSRGP